MYRHSSNPNRLLPILAACIWITPAIAETNDNDDIDQTRSSLETIEVIGIAPAHGTGLPKEKLPYSVQSATSEDLQKSQSLDLTEYMNRYLGSVTANAAQNNPLQPDLQYRGFTASPLLGVPQGISVYQNGVRIQEPFGDNMNWELLPENAIASMNLIGGSNPLFGLNTLGGAISLQTKNGFSHPGHSIEVYGGSYDRVVTQAESGWNNGQFGYYGAFNYFSENGWRENSPSDVKNFYGTVGWRGDDSTMDLSFTYGNSDLTGNGPLPVQLMEQDRSTIFTSPDQTRNEMYMGIIEASHWINDKIQLSGTGFYRHLNTNSFNGDGTEFVECEEPANAGFRCEQNDAGEEVVLDQFGNPVTEDDNAVNNISKTPQKSYGFNLNNTFFYDLFDMDNQLIIGGGWNGGEADFDSKVEIAQLNPDRSTTRTGRFADGEITQVNSRTETWSLYISDTLSVTETINLTFSGRFNSTQIKIRDRSGQNPDLNGDHRFQRFNPAGGITWQAHELVNVYGGYSESTRAPTPVELVCASPDAPCNLPNAFLADPPLEQVVAKTFEGGFRGSLNRVANINIGDINWHLGAFHTLNKNDIIFQTTGGTTGNQGFFDNIGDTRRVGAELGLNGRYNIVSWFLNYSFVDATYRDGFQVNSPNHPDADANGTVNVAKGNQIPGIPQHSLKFGTDIQINLLPGLSLGWDAVYNSGQYLRGDEANLLAQTDDYIVFNLRADYSVNDHMELFVKVNNLFDTNYETFGLLGEPDEVLGAEFDDPRFLGPAAGRGIWGGIRLRL